MHFNKGKAYGRQGKAPKGVKFQHSILLSFLGYITFFFLFPYGNTEIALLSLFKFISYHWLPQVYESASSADEALAPDETSPEEHEEL